MGARLNFYGNEVQIIFESGSESLYFNSKEEILLALIDCFNKNKINYKDFKKMSKKIIHSKKIQSIFEDKMKEIFNLIQKILKEIFFEEVHPRLCFCKKTITHGYFYDKYGDKILENFFCTKEEAYNMAKFLLSKKQISKETFINLKVEIDLLKIPHVWDN